MSERCPCCGQPLPPEDAVALLTPTQRRIYETLRMRPGLTFEQLRDAVFSDREDGGPESRSAIHHPIVRMNQRLAHLGVRIAADRTGAVGTSAPRWYIYQLKWEAAA